MFSREAGKRWRLGVERDCAILNDQKVVAPRGGGWQATQVIGLLASISRLHDAAGGGRSNPGTPRLFLIIAKLEDDDIPDPRYGPRRSRAASVKRFGWFN